MDDTATSSTSAQRMMVDDPLSSTHLAESTPADSSHTSDKKARPRAKLKLQLVFLCGPLRHPQVLQDLLSLPKPPILRDAVIHGFMRTMRNDRIVVIRWRRGSESEKVPEMHGAAYKFSLDQQLKLRTHMGCGYEYHTAVIHVEGKKKLGKVLAYNVKLDPHWPMGKWAL
jgi:hypothetical protein